MIPHQRLLSEILLEHGWFKFQVSQGSLGWGEVLAMS